MGLYIMPRYAGADEITEEMTQAGAARLAQYDPDYSDDEKTVREIFLAMMAVRHRACRSTFGRDG